MKSNKAVAIKLLSQTRLGVGVFSECLEFTRLRNDRGYGRMWAAGKVNLAHRLAMYLKNGEWPKGFVLHRCDNPPCINPDHLFIGTHSDNMRDMVSKGRNWNPGANRTFCINGHEFTKENTGAHSYVGGRYCKECSRIGCARYYQKNKARKSEYNRKYREKNAATISYKKKQKRAMMKARGEGK